MFHSQHQDHHLNQDFKNLKHSIVTIHTSFIRFLGHHLYIKAISLLMYVKLQCNLYIIFVFNEILQKQNNLVEIIKFNDRKK